MEQFFDRPKETLNHIPQPIPIGTHGSVTYLIESLYQELPHVEPCGSIQTPNPDDLYHDISMFVAEHVLTSKPIDVDLKFGFTLGGLLYKFYDMSEPEDAGFYVICNAVDKSIWIAFDFKPYSELGYLSPIRPKNRDEYGTLPTYVHGGEVGAMKIVGADWTTQQPVGSRGDLFGAGSPIPCKLKAKPAIMRDVLQAVKADERRNGRTEPGSLSSE